MRTGAENGRVSVESWVWTRGLHGRLSIWVDELSVAPFMVLKPRDIEILSG